MSHETQLPKEMLDQLTVVRTANIRAGYLQWWELVPHKTSRFPYRVFFRPPKPEEINRENLGTVFVPTFYNRRRSCHIGPEFGLGVWRATATAIVMDGELEFITAKRLTRRQLRTKVLELLRKQPKIIRRPHILGVRAWRVRHGRLISPIRRSVWRTVTSARGWSTHDAVLGEAGLHALWPPRGWNWRGTRPPAVEYFRPWLYKRSPDKIALGLVQAVGPDYVLGTHGWRARKVMVLKIWVHPKYVNSVALCYREAEVLPLLPRRDELNHLEGL